QHPIHQFALSSFYLLFSLYPAHRDLHSFPTRRSSDLSMQNKEPAMGQIVEISFKGRRKGYYVADFEVRPDWYVIVEADRGEDLGDRKSTRLNSSHVKISYAVFCLKKKKTT